MSELPLAVCAHVASVQTLYPAAGANLFTCSEGISMSLSSCGMQQCINAYTFVL